MSLDKSLKSIIVPEASYFDFQTLDDLLNHLFKSDSEIKKSSLIKDINNEISEAEGEIKEKKETALAEISSISESLAIEMLENLSVGKIDKGKIAALSKMDN